MANTTKTKIRLPISSNILEAIRKQFQYVFVEETGVYTITRGFELHHLLLKLSKEYGEALIAEHSTSLDRYSTLYIERYKDGKSETIETKTDYIICYEDKYRYLMTESVYNKIYNALEEYSDFKEIRFTLHLRERYRFTVNKVGKTAFVEIKDYQEELYPIDESLYGKSFPVRRVVDKSLIPALNLGAIGQNPYTFEDNWTRLY
jgi:hypothetical protein